MTFLKWLEHQGKALVIRGPQGCGKGLLATQLAKEEGEYSIAHIDEITDKQSNVYRWLNNEPKTVIVEGFPESGVFDKVKPLIADTKISCERRGKDQITIDAPMLIFCTHDAGPPNFGENNRRFFVIDMTPGR